MELAARAETWLRVHAGKLVGPPAPTADEVDQHGFFVLSSVAQALTVLEVLDAPTIDAVFSDLGIAAGVRGRRVSPNELRTAEGFAWQMQTAATGGAAAPASPAVEPWPAETFDAGTRLEVDGGLVHVLWVTRTPAGSFAPVRVRFPPAGAAATAVPRRRQVAATMAVSVPFGPRVPGVEVVDGGGGVHDLAWPLAQGDGVSSWGTAEIAPDLPPSPTTLTYRVAGEVAEVAFAPPVPCPVGKLDDPDCTPAERYLDRWDGRALEETWAALRDLGLVRPGYVPAAKRDVPPDKPVLQSWQRLRPPSLAVPAAARVVGVLFPLSQQAVYVEGLTVESERVVVHVRFRKIAGARPVLWWDAEDAAGLRRETRVTEGWHGGGAMAAGIEISLQDGEELRELRLVASTPFDSAWVELSLPARPPVPPLPGEEAPA